MQTAGAALGAIRLYIQQRVRARQVDDRCQRLERAGIEQRDFERVFRPVYLLVEVQAVQREAQEMILRANAERLAQFGLRNRRLRLNGGVRREQYVTGVIHTFPFANPPFMSVRLAARSNYVGTTLSMAVVQLP